MRLPYSPHIIKNNLVFTSGQIPLKDGTLIEGTIEDKTHQVMKNLEAVLKDAGVSFNDVVKVTIYTTDLSSYQRINEVYVGYFTGMLPAREMVEVKALPLGAEIEISMIAALPTPKYGK